MHLYTIICASCIVLAAASLHSCDSDVFEDAFLANVTSGLPPKLRHDFCIRNGTNAVLAPGDTGIVHYVLTGSIALHQLDKRDGQFSTLQLGEVALLSADQVPVTLHLWMRALCDGVNVTVRGHGMLQEVHPLHKINGKVEIELQLTALTPKPQQQHLFDVFWREEKEHTRFNSPFTIETTIPVQEVATHYMLHIGGFRQHVIYSPKVYDCQPAFTRQSPVLFTVIPHSHTNVEDPERVELTTKMIVAHVRHHIKLGLAGTVHYDVEPFLSHLVKDSAIQELILQGNLRLIRWDMEVQGYMPDGLVWHKNRAKTLQYNHAILAHWGLDVYINPVDIDEFLASKEPFTMQQLLANQCLLPGGQTNLYIYDIRCGTCQAREADIWLQSGGNPLMMYNETDWKIRLRGKPILHADTSFSMSIHESGLFHGGSHHLKRCLFHLHVVNLFSYRRTITDNSKFSADTSWDWSIGPGNDLGSLSM